jgi:hypothetical protein
VICRDSTDGGIRAWFYEPIVGQAPWHPTPERRGAPALHAPAHCWSSSMPVYTFYPHRPDGSAVTFEAHELACDRTAIDRAHEVLKNYESSVVVAVWDGERHVGERRREREDQVA